MSKKVTYGIIVICTVILFGIICNGIYQAGVQERSCRDAGGQYAEYLDVCLPVGDPRLRAD